MVASGFVDGVIITATRMGDPLLARMAVGAMPLVMVGRPDIDGVSYVDVDNAGGARMVVRHLVGLGHRRIGLVGAPENTTAGLDRLNGFLDGLSEAGLALDAELRRDGNYSESSGFRAMSALIPHRPDAVFAASDTMARGALRAVREANLRVPDDIAVVGFDGLSASANTSPSLTTVRQPVEATAARAVRMLLDLVDGVTTAPTSEIMSVELLTRESCGAGIRSAGSGAKGV